MNDTTRPAAPEAPRWDPDDIVPLAALQHYLYCPRQCALIHVEQVWTENLYTLRGRRAHERVHDAGGSTRDGTRTERALPLFSDRLGLVGVADVVEFAPDGTPTPVEHKVGSRTKGSRAKDADILQVAAQAVCLEDMFGLRVDLAALYYGATRRRLEVPITDDLRASVETVAGQVRALVRAARLPAPAADARCTRCSLIETCMPFVVDRLALPEPADDGDDL